MPSAQCAIRVPKAHMKLAKQDRIPVLRRPAAADALMNRNITLCRLPFSSLAVCALLICCAAPAQAAEALPVKHSGTQPAQVQQPSGEPQGYQMRRYQAFARQAELPPITVTSETTIEVGGVVKTDTFRLAQISTAEKETLAGQFGVPAGVIAKLAQRASDNPPPAAAQFAQELRTAVIDYRFLQDEWGRYQPPLEGRQTKTDALAALQAGDLAQAWALYDGLSRPQAPAVARPSPPANLRIVASP
jgi:hypothetical protein